jgi:hypothetical protein
LIDWNRALGLKLTGDFVPGKLGTVGLIKPFTTVDLLSIFGFCDERLIINLIV